MHLETKAETSDEKAVGVDELDLGRRNELDRGRSGELDHSGVLATTLVLI